MAAAPAWAEDAAPFSFGPDAGVFVLGGLTAGGSFGSPGGGGFVGGELSIVRLKLGAWVGLFADGAYDFGHGAGTFTVGPEVGFAVLGFDGGPAFRVGLADDLEVGVSGRMLITLGTFALFGRYSHWFDSPSGTHVGQVGVLFKLPLWSSAPQVEMAQ